MSSPLDLRRGPLVAPAILFACGLAAGRLHPFFESAGLCLPVALGPMLLVGALLRRLRPAQIRGAAIIAGLPFCLGLLASALRTDEARPSFPAGPMEIRGTIAAAPRPRRGSARGPEGLLAPVVGLQLTGVVAEGRPLGGKLPVIVPGDPDVGRGDRLRLRGWVRQAGGPLLVRLPEHLRLIERGRDPRGVLDRLRRKIRRRWLRRFGPREGPWLAALLLGDRRLLPGGIPLRFRRIGQTHLLAISGLHVGLLVAIFGWPASRLRIRGRRWGTPLSVFLLCLYAGLAGGDAPVARAVIFGILGRIATLRGGGANLLNALALALLLLGAWGGGSSRGLVLSFSAVTGILLLAPGEGRAPRPKGVLRRLRRGILRGLRVSSGAWLGASVPLLLWTPEMVPWGPIFSLLFLPLLGALLATGVLSLLPGASLLDPLLGPILCAEVGLLEGLARLLDHLPATPWSWPPIPPIAGALAVASVAAFIRGRASRGWPVALILLAALAALRPPQGPGASLISLGRGQGLLIRGEESTLLLDAGSVDRAAGGAIAIRDTLRAAGRDRCDLVLLSHPHADHVLALPGLLERIPIGGVAVGPRFGISPLGAALLRWLRRRGTPVHVLWRGHAARVGDLELGILHPPRRYPEILEHTLNDDSLVARVGGHGLDLVAAGDLQEMGLALMPPPAAVDILVLPHHGTPAPGLRAWLEAVHPRLAIASTSRSLPRRTVRILDAAGIPSLHTGRDGAVHLAPAAAGWRPRETDRRRR